MVRRTFESLQSRLNATTGDFVGTSDTQTLSNKTLSVPVIDSLTTTERDALTPTNGMLIYNETTNKFQGRAGGVWVDLH